MAFTIEKIVETSSSSSSATSSTASSSSTTSSVSLPIAPLTYRDIAKATTEQLDLSNFAELPYDLRSMIWEATFVSRLIPLVCETVELSAQFDPPFKHITHFRATSSFVTSVNLVEKTSFLTCRKLPSPAALGVNRESRNIALSKYRPWRMFNKDLQYRNIMWCPNLDVVDLLRAVPLPGSQGSQSSQSEAPKLKPLVLIEKQFPAELVEIKNIAVPSTLWGEGQHKNIDVIWPLIDFLSLEELIVVLEKNKEREFAYCPTRGLSTVALDADVVGSVNWTIPQDIEHHIAGMRNHYERFGPEYMPLRKKPVVTIIENEHKIFGNQDLHVIIRCRPCKFLGVST